MKVPATQVSRRKPGRKALDFSWKPGRGCPRHWPSRHADFLQTFWDFQQCWSLTCEEGVLACVYLSLVEMGTLMASEPVAGIGWRSLAKPSCQWEKKGSFGRWEASRASSSKGDEKG